MHYDYVCVCVFFLNKLDIFDIFDLGNFRKRNRRTRMKNNAEKKEMENNIDVRLG